MIRQANHEDLPSKTRNYETNFSLRRLAVLIRLPLDLTTNLMDGLIDLQLCLPNTLNISES